LSPISKFYENRNILVFNFYQEISKIIDYINNNCFHVIKMNQPDANYWLTLAAQWIQSKSQTQVNFPAFAHLPPPPEAPRITDATNNDNLVEADMEIEDAKEEHESPQNWSNWHNKEPTPIVPIISLQPHPIVQTNPKHFPVKQQNHFNEHRNEFINNTQFNQIPSIIDSSVPANESIQSVDMVLDSDDEDDENEEEDIESEEIQAQKRKKLPVWIREGLERIEREKRLEQERIQKEKEQQESEENRKKMMEEALRELEREKFTKSRYESDSDDDGNENPRADNSETDHNLSNRRAAIDESQDEEDNHEKMMLLVRKTLTEIFLEVTHEKIVEIRLGVYSNSSDEESDDEEKGKSDDQDDGWEPESAVKERIRIKSIAFEQRAKEIRENLAKAAESEQERFSKRHDDVDDKKSSPTKHDPDNERTNMSRSRKNDGEEKYEQIYSISSSFASSGLPRDKKKSRFNDPKDRTTSILVTHVGLMDATVKSTSDSVASSVVVPAAPSFYPSVDSVSATRKKKEKSKKRSSSSSSTSSSSSSSDRHRKHKKHKKSSKHKKKSSRRRSRSRSRDKRKSHKSDRHSIESKSSIRSSESRKHRSRSRSRSHHRSRRY
ncbi:CLUMA_CG017899, isoform A, partial [Clunio marinus]